MKSGVDNSKTVDTYENPDSLIELDRIVPYGTKTCNDYLYYCLFASLCFENGNVIKHQDVIIMRELVEHELPVLFSNSLGVKVTSISSPHHMEQFLENSPIRKEKILRVREHPTPVLCQIGGGYSVIWFSISAIYHCETFIEGLYYLTVCSLRNLLDCCIHAKLTDVVIGDNDGGECHKVQKELEHIMYRSRFVQSTSERDIRNEELDSFKQEYVEKYMRVAHDLIQCTERSESGVPSKWEDDINVITFWYKCIVNIFGVYPATKLDMSAFSSSEDEFIEEEVFGIGDVYQVDL